MKIHWGLLFLIVIILFSSGEWKIETMYDGETVQGSPYWVNVFDPSLVYIRGLEGGKVGRELSFQGREICYTYYMVHHFCIILKIWMYYSCEAAYGEYDD